MPPAPLHARFLAHLSELGIGGEPSHLLVAVSGGCDSVVLLDLLEQAARALPLTITAAHLDHGMREGSAADARWVLDLCAARGIPLLQERLGEPPRSEGAARAARYEFLRRAAGSSGADLIATAHTADDQAETVLFRAVRGTGLRGLGGIRGRTRAGLVRPLLPFWRRELVEHARAAGLHWREDPSNRDLRFSRNRIRHRILPEIEEEIAPGARRNLCALAALAREADSALERLARDAERVLVRREGPALVLARDRLRDYDPAIATRLVRRLLRRLGAVPGRVGTRAALQFITEASSGREMQLPSGVRVRLEFGEARVERVAEELPDRAVEISAEPGSREARLRVGGSDFRVRYGPEPPPDDPARWRLELETGRHRFPLLLRAWRPGDRIRTAGGTKSLKKLFLEERIPRSRRGRLPVLVDASGEVLWVAGVRRDLLPGRAESGQVLFLTITDD